MFFIYVSQKHSETLEVRLISQTIRQFYSFLSACQGNWRNSVHISTDGPGYLLSADRDGRPIIMAVEQFQQITGESIDPAECCAQLTEDAFKSLYAQYLLWAVPSSEADPLAILCQGIPAAF